MNWWRHLESGEISEKAASPRPADAWEQIDDPPAADGWRWNNDARAWQARGKRFWEPAEFLATLLTPAEVVAIDAVPTSTPNGELLRWAVLVARAVQRVNLDDPNTEALVTLAVLNGVLSPARAARIIAGLPPE